MGVKIIVHNVVIDDNKILLLQRSKDVKNLPEYWDIPGGSLEKGEDPKLGAIRETAEESGLKVAETNIYYYFSNYEPSQEMQYITLIFKSNYTGGDVKLNSEEHQDYKWVEIPSLLEFYKNNKTPNYFKGLIDKLISPNK